MDESTPVNPKRRDLAAGLLVMLVCGGVVLSRGGTPEQGFAEQIPGHARPVPVDDGPGTAAPEAVLEPSDAELRPPLDAVAPGVTRAPSSLATC